MTLLDRIPAPQLDVAAPPCKADDSAAFVEDIPAARVAEADQEETPALLTEAIDTTTESCAVAESQSCRACDAIPMVALGVAKTVKIAADRPLIETLSSTSQVQCADRPALPCAQAREIPLLPERHTAESCGGTSEDTDEQLGRSRGTDEA